MATNSKFNADLGLKTDADLQVDGNVTVSGNLTVNGTQTTVNSTTTSVEDSMLELANANLSSDTLDIGIYGNYDDGLGDGVSEYTGFFRDATDSTWKLFDGLESEPTTTVNTSGTGYTLADLQVGDLTATTLTATNSLTGSSITYPTSDGTNGQVLKTDGSGTLSFGDIPAGYTDSDARSAISVSGDLSYDSSTGVISYSDSDTTYTDSDVESYLDGGTSTPTFASAIVDGGTGEGSLYVEGTYSSSPITARLLASDGGAVFFGSSTNHDVRIQTNSSNRMTIDTNGETSILRAGSGGTGILTALKLNHAGTSVDDGPKIAFSSGTSSEGAGISSGGKALNSADLRFTTGGTNERLRITQTGEVVVGGTEIPSTVLDGTGAAGALGVGNSSELYPAIAMMSSARNWLLYQNTAGSLQIYDSTGNHERFSIDEYGTIMSAGTNGSFAHNTYAHAAVFGRNSVPLGTVVIEDYDVSSGIGNTVLNLYLRDQDPATSATFIKFTDGGGTVGSVTHNDDGGGVSFNTTSDYRLKENVNYDWDATTLLKQLKPAKFNFISNPAKTVQGMLAHEVMDIVPSSVRGERDHEMEIGTITDSNGDVVYEGVYEHFCKTDEGQTWTQTGTEPLYQELDYSRLVPLLTKTIQELEARITELESS